MTLLNPWILFALIPLFFLHKRYIPTQTTRQTHLLYLALFFMILSVSRPALMHSTTEQKFKAQDYIIALDASYSMQADDLKPSRYVLAKRAIKRLLELHTRDRFTLFVFTSNALLISPPSTDRQLSIQALDAINPKYILTKSTSLRHLFETVAKISSHKKKLIIFSDGGDEHNIAALVQIIKKNNITPYLVATATQKGAALKRNGKYLKNIHNALVISKINPMLKDLANASHGKYYELTSLNTINKLANDLQTRQGSKSITLKVKSYKELFTIPLTIALILYFIAVTKIHQLYLLVPLVFLPYKANASLLDFYYLSQATKNYQQKHYHQAALKFKKVTPSVKSYYNSASAYYKAGEYKNALRYFTQIKTGNKKIKQAILYDIANCAVHLKKYDAAKAYYVKALALGYDSDAFYNLNLLIQKKLKTSKNIAKKDSSRQTKKKKHTQQKKQKNFHSKHKGGNSSSNRKSIQSTNGKGRNKKKQKSYFIVQQKNKNNNYKMAYKAYEIINKGYSDEKEPW